MKKLTFTALAAALLLLATGCTNTQGENTGETEGSVLDNVPEVIEGDISGSELPFDYMANDLSSNIKLGEYKGLSVVKESDVLTDEEFENEISVLLDNYSYYEEYTDRAVEEGDTVLCDYAGYRDGTAFEGGTAEGVNLTAAPNTGYIEGFCEAFVGQMPGQEFSFNVTFPEDYGNADLAGVEVTFVCTVHAILGDELIVPELTDEFVKENFGFNTAEEFRISYRKTVEDQKKHYVDSAMYSDLWLQVVDNAEVLAYPEEEVNRIYNEQRSMYEQYAVSFGVDYATFLSSYLGMTDEDLLDESRTYVKEDLVMYQLIKDLGVEITEETYNEGLAFFAESYGMTTDDLISYYGEDTIRSTILWQELMEVVAKDAVVTEE